MFLTNFYPDGVSPQQQFLVMLPLCTTTVKVDELSHPKTSGEGRAGRVEWVEIRLGVD